MRKESYEKHIADLESTIEELRNSLSKEREARALDAAKASSMREGFFRGLNSFLANLYQELGGIQSNVLDNISKLNKEMMETTNERVRATVLELNRALPPVVEGSEYGG